MSLVVSLRPNCILFIAYHIPCTIYYIPRNDLGTLRPNSRSDPPVLYRFLLRCRQVMACRIPDRRVLSKACQGRIDRSALGPHLLETTAVSPFCCKRVEKDQGDPYQVTGRRGRRRRRRRVVVVEILLMDLEDSSRTPGRSPPKRTRVLD